MLAAPVLLIVMIALMAQVVLLAQLVITIIQQIA
jgi:hypothetical protein